MPEVANKRTILVIRSISNAVVDQVHQVTIYEDPNIVCKAIENMIKAKRFSMKPANKRGKQMMRVVPR